MYVCRPPQFLIGKPIGSAEAMVQAAHSLLDMMNGGSEGDLSPGPGPGAPGKKGVLVKGGHFGAAETPSLSQDYLLLAERDAGAGGGWATQGMWLSSPR